MHFLRIRLKRSSSSFEVSMPSNALFRFTVIILISRGVKSPPIVVGSRKPLTFFHYDSSILINRFLVCEMMKGLILISFLIRINCPGLIA